MSFEVREEGSITVVSISEPRLDASLAEGFKNFLFDQIDKGSTTILVDLTHVRFMDSSGLGALVAALKKVLGKGELKLAAPQPAVKDLFELTSMEKLFSIFESVDIALSDN
ncbi:MAG: STAS domain-containing protein [Endozoicomonas sp. (ex Botrylloides leachii)]|nr:STAS domain-containing protein [Endozoicomonas sp. (ex Botrylloides leachii)]